ncbi:hypothetical protein JOB18_013959 [Solea senegalensis]|uniref:Cilia- and flagella-associated protein 418 n=1 Tax=Solea senegalensis TaxID=28829 RepID=A0AAV6PFB2_SOLSE|nr:hypothetical protein JOB18_013959 [Solea senegalensis]
MDADDLDLDLDELLDEVEEKFCRHVSVASSARGHADTREEVRQKRHTRSATKPTVQKNSISEDIDALLEDLLDDQQHRDTAQLKREQIPAEKKPSSQSGGRRCCPVFIGGSSLTNGVGTATTKRCGKPFILPSLVITDSTSVCVCVCVCIWTGHVTS